MRGSARVVAGVLGLGLGLLTLEGAALSVGLSHSGQITGLSTVRALKHATTIVARTSAAVVQRILVDRLGEGMLGAVCWSRDVIASIAPVVAAPEPCRNAEPIGDLVAASVMGRIGAQCGHSVIRRVRVRTNERARVVIIERDGVMRDVIRELPLAPRARRVGTISS
jgi:hypothetical protein